MGIPLPSVYSAITKTVKCGRKNKMKRYTIGFPTSDRSTESEKVLFYVIQSIFQHYK